MENKLTIGEKIKLARGHKSQKELADCIKVSNNTISRWENNEFSPSFDDVVKISSFTNKSLDWFAGRSYDNDERERRNCVGDLMQWSSQSDLIKIKAVIELLKK